MVRDASREGTVELATLMAGIVPAAADLDAVAATVGEDAHRAAVVSGMRIDVRVLHGGEARLTSPVRLALVRVFQESLHNALEHGAATQIDVELAADPGEVTISVSDNGVGFVPSARAVGSGLDGMRARASELGGTFALVASPGGGARVRFTLPRQPAGAT
jgi:signal transduction histidine kinase